MTEQSEDLSLLRCVKCGKELARRDVPERYAGSDGVDRELACVSCGRAYPVVRGVPILFRDDERTKVLIDSTEYEARLRSSGSKMRRASRLAGGELDGLKEEAELSDALGWEILFWERWKESDEGFVAFDRARMEEYLAGDEEAGGRLRFLERVARFSHGLSGKRLLNVGAGRDFLLERLIEMGCQVVEIDIVLEPLVLLAERGASLCVCCDARALPFASDAFDVSTSFGSLHHIWPIEEPIAELLRVTSGAIHINEPNYFALTRAALLLPGPLKGRLKQFHAGEYSRSPYEGCINPFRLKRAVRRLGARTVDLSFPRSSWITREAAGVRRALRSANLLAVGIAPVLSSHFDAVIAKDGADGRRRSDN